ncbi:MAG: hypothetical protein JRI22_15315 [Deltaproteobacteria bacterium]|nr:hypothetical protein [Deltaproteobacteria bacterium]
MFSKKKGMSSFNVLKSHRVSSEEVHPVSLDAMPQKEKQGEIAVFRKSWNSVCPSSETGVKDEESEGERANTIIEEAQAKAQLIEKEAYEKAYSLGQKEGLEVAERKFRSALQSLKKAHGEFQKLKEELVLRSERELIATCLAISRKVISQEIVQNKDVLLNLIRCGLRYVLDKDRVRIRVNPSDFQYVMQCGGEIISSSEDIRDMAFEEDERIARGDAVIETRFGNVDCRFGTRMAEIEKSFMEILAEKDLKAPLSGEDA